MYVCGHEIKILKKMVNLFKNINRGANNTLQTKLAQRRMQHKIPKMNEIQ